MKDEFDNDVDDGPVAVLMDCVESMCATSHAKYPNCTFISMKSGEGISVRAPFEEVYDIWLACVEPINIK